MSNFPSVTLGQAVYVRKVYNFASPCKIARGGFLSSSQGMIGPVVYFARSLEAAIGKVGRNGGHGAWFIAEIRMGKVYAIEKRLIDITPGNMSYNVGLHRFVSSGEWHTEYDTCYCIHQNDNLDEFCIKDPQTQIIRWVIVIEEEHDPKVKKLGLDIDTEFESTAYSCF